MDDRVYSLEGVTEVRPETVLKRVSVSTKIWQVVCWLLVVAVVAGIIYSWILSSIHLHKDAPITLGGLFECYCVFVVPWVFAFRMGNFDKIERYHCASVILMRGKQMQRIIIGAFRHTPSQDLKRRMLNMGYHPETIERWAKEYELGSVRAKTIVEAVGDAIGRRA